jgi:alpha-beta hydrolase superfamily lysophospholipase
MIGLMSSKRILTIFLLGLILIAACRPEPNNLTPSPASPQAPTTTINKQVTIELPTGTSVSTKKPTPESTQVTPPTTPVETEIGEFPRELTEEVLIPVEGLDLFGTYYFPADHSPPRPGVILIHMLHGDQSQWESFPEQLADAGFVVLSIDLRGHGESGGEVNWDMAISDLQQVWNQFTARGDIDQERTAFVGASIGANLALVASSNETAVRTAVLLSPGLSYAGVNTEPAIHSYSERPLLIIASQEDSYAANSSKALDENTIGNSQLIMYQGAGHGTLMLRAEPDLNQIIIDWLNQKFD